MYSIQVLLEPNKFIVSKTIEIKPLILQRLVVLKNSNLFNNSKPYNIYQIDAQMDLDTYANLSQRMYLLHLIITESPDKKSITKPEKLVETILYVDKLYFINEDTKTNLVTVRIFAINVIVAEMLIDNGISATSVQQLQNAFADPSSMSWTTQQPISGQFFDKSVQQFIQGFYGESCYATYIGNSVATNSSVTEYFKIPTQLNSIETIRYILLNLWPYFGVPQFTIDDFFNKPKLLIKFDEIITSLSEINTEKNITNNNTSIKIKRLLDNSFFESLTNVESEFVDDFNLTELLKFSKSDIVNSTVNGIKNIKTVKSNFYQLINNSLLYQENNMNPFVTVIQSDMNKYDIEKFTKLANEVVNLKLNLEIRLPIMDLKTIDLGQIFSTPLKPKEKTLHYFYIYEIEYIFTRTTENLNVTHIEDINVNNFNLKSKIKSIEITDCPKVFDF